MDWLLKVNTLYKRAWKSRFGRRFHAIMDLEEVRQRLLSNLCKSCRAFCEECSVIHSPEQGWTKFPVHQTKAELEAAIKNGCHLCYALWYSVLSETDGMVDIELREVASEAESYLGLRYQAREWTSDFEMFESATKSRSFLLSVSYCYNKRCIYGDKIRVISPEEDIGLLANAVLPSDEDTSTGSSKAFELASKWLSTCQAEHNCSSEGISDSAPEGWVPTRLVDVGLEGRLPRLVLSNSLATTESGPLSWFTLSHCWGKSPQCRLLGHNLSQFLEALPLDELPQTLLDAIDATRRLGSRYIWIDCLCIIQEDTEDWSREAATMSLVYGLSTCTLSASHAKDGEGGCYSKRNPRMVVPCIVPMTFHHPYDGRTETCFCIVGQEFDKYWSTNVEERPLYQRAWAMQERLLSPRTLFFGKHQLLWSCGSRETCETFEHTSRRHVEDIRDGGCREAFVRLLESMGETRWGVEPISSSLEWCQFVHDYSRSMITYPTDRVVAFSGIPAAILAYRDTDRKKRKGTNPKLQQSYGIWLDDQLSWSLLWDARFLPEHDQSYTIAPSWSWLSLNGPVDHRIKLSAQKGLVEGLGFLDFDHSTVGNVVAPVLRLPGYKEGLVVRGVLKVSWSLPKPMRKVSEPGRSQSSVHDLGYAQPSCFEETISIRDPDFETSLMHLQQRLDMLLSESTQEHVPDKVVREHKDDAWWFEDFQGGSNTRGNVVVCLPLIDDPGYDLAYQEDPPVLSGLVLEHVVLPDASELPEAGKRVPYPVFRRIGTFRLDRSGRDKTKWVATTDKVDILLI